MSESVTRRQVANQQPITALAWSPDGKMLVSGGKDHIVRLWDVEAGDCGCHRAHRWAVSEVCFSPDGDTVASVSQGKSSAKGKSDAVLWNLRTRKTISLPRQKSHRFRNPLFLSSETTAFKYGNISLFNVRSGKNGQVIRESVVGDVFAVSPDFRTLVFGSIFGTLHVWDVDEKCQRRELVGHDSQVVAIASDSSGECFASYSPDGDFCIWTLHQSQPLSITSLPISDLRSLAYCSRTNTWACVDSEATITRVDLEGQIQEQVALPLRALIASAAWSSSQSLLATGDYTGAIRVWPLESLEGLNAVASSHGTGETSPGD